MEKQLLIPEYIYKGRTTEDATRIFEQLFYEDINDYDEYLKSNSDVWDMAKRIGYTFFYEVKAEIDKRGTKLAGC